MAFGIGALLFNNILLKLINPDNLHPTNHIFPKSVADNVPYALKTISIIYLGIGTAGCLLLIPKCNKVNFIISNFKIIRNGRIKDF